MKNEEKSHVYECNTCHKKEEYSPKDEEKDSRIKCPNCELGEMERISGGDKYY